MLLLRVDNIFSVFGFVVVTVCMANGLSSGLIVIKNYCYCYYYVRGTGKARGYITCYHDTSQLHG